MSGRVHLINPSDVVVWRRRHHAALAVRAGRGHRHALGRSASSSTKRSTSRPRDHRARRRRRHRHSHRQRAARLRDRPAGARARRLGRVRRHSRDAVSRRGARARRARTPSCKGDGDLVWQQVVEDCVAGRPAPLYDGGRVARRAVRVGALGPAAGGPLHVGVGPDRARLPEALLVLLGLAHRRPGAAAARRRPRRPRNRRAAAPAGSGSSRWPTTISIRSRSTIWRRRAAASDPARLHGAGGAARRSASS